jgi:hypothetical protein
MLIIVALGVISCVYLILRCTPVEKYSKLDSEVWPSMERNISWDHELGCRCRTCRD